MTRVQVVSHSWQRVPPPRRWSLTPGRRPTYREVDRAPRFFTDDRFDADCPSPTDVDTGALIDLDLDDAGPYPLRPPAVIAEVSAAGDDLWALDAVLPLAFRIDSDHRASEYLFPGPVRYGRSVWATPTGCWIGGPDGTHRLTPGEPARTVDDTPVVAGAVVGEHFLACGGAGRWSIHGPGGESRSVEVPTAVVTAAIADGDSFVVLLHSPSPRTDGVVLVRVGLDGAMDVGDPVILDDHHDRPSLLTSPLGIACYDSVVTLAPTLEATDTQHVPRRFFYAGTVGDGLWTLGHPPDGTAVGVVAATRTHRVRPRPRPVLVAHRPRPGRSHADSQRPSALVHRVGRTHRRRDALGGGRRGAADPAAGDHAVAGPGRSRPAVNLGLQ
ncbi:hypothetical protein [Gordonia polyisoprenivorans]|uniref:hypothetical protein n=1 Tax=Gordonia polyisoprenivorans TaxID=84595 RepID=UPI001F0B24EF|nr:hypothetical protein [Gordonia polyisoprenivorans]